MVKIIRWFFYSLLFVMISFVQAKAEITEGEELHDDNCVTCHNNWVYTRKDRLIKNFDGLKNQVRFCDAQLEIGLFDSEIEEIAIYLDNRYYKFVK